MNSVVLDNSDRLATKADLTEGESSFGNLKSLKNMLDTLKIFQRSIFR
ncbi:hypothetical protein [Butyrivibrio sp. FCS014]|nr:hypothetical protein [Butyrivibrio sp. FCS014]